MNYVWYFALLAQLDRAPDFYVVETSGRRGFEPRAGLQPTRAPVPGKFAECLITDGIRDKPRAQRAVCARASGTSGAIGISPGEIFTTCEKQLGAIFTAVSPPFHRHLLVISPPFHRNLTAISPGEIFTG